MNVFPLAGKPTIAKHTGVFAKLLEGHEAG
jgi:hypothetical protein